MKNKATITFKFVLTVIPVVFFLITALAVAIISITGNMQSKQADNFIRVLKEEQAKEKDLLRQSILKKGESLTSLLRQNAATLIATFDYEPLALSSKNVANDPDIVFVTFYSADNTPLTNRPRVDQSTHIIKQEILFQNELVGYIETGMTFDSIEQKMNEISERINRLVDETVISKAEARKRVITSTLWLSSAGIAALCLIIYLSISFIVIKPIKNTTHMVKDIAEGEGDLTIRLESKSNDEIGEMVTWFNLFLNKLQEMIIEIADNTKMLSTTSSEFSEISGDMTKDYKQISEKSNSLASAADQMSVNLKSVAVSTEEVSSTVGEIAKTTARALSITNDAVSKSKHAFDNMSKLGNSVQQINQITETITKISEQTNLLALNATIEAARAGAAGKGFSVVANEIKDLAMQTATATVEIRNTLESIQGATKISVDQITEVSNIINEVNEIVNFISVGIEEQNATAQEIAKNIDQSSNVSDQITIDIVDINTSASEISSRSNKVDDSSGKLKEMSEELSKIVSKFKTIKKSNTTVAEAAYVKPVMDDSNPTTI